MKFKQILTAFTLVLVASVINSTTVCAQTGQQKFRIANIEVYPEYLDEYKAALAEHAKVAVKVEPGVIALQAVYDLSQTTHVTVFEVYASEEAYQTHLKTPHFLKYKNGTIKMVKALKLVEVAPIGIEIKPDLNLLTNYQN